MPRVRDNGLMHFEAAKRVILYALRCNEQQNAKRKKPLTTCTWRFTFKELLLICGLLWRSSSSLAIEYHILLICNMLNAQGWILRPLNGTVLLTDDWVLTEIPNLADREAKYPKITWDENLATSGNHLDYDELAAKIEETRRHLTLDKEKARARSKFRRRRIDRLRPHPGIRGSR